VIWTIGHGSRSIDEFLGLLADSAIECVVDVRAYPSSRRHPQFARDALERSLASPGIRYVWEGSALGGRRKPGENSPNVALNNPGFRAYADHMATEAFRAGLQRLLELERSARAAILCAERLPWQCHRNLIADSLAARGARVLHLMGARKSIEHTLSPLARIEGERLVYDAGKQSALGL